MVKAIKKAFPQLLHEGKAQLKKKLSILRIQTQLPPTLSTRAFTINDM